jgi:hypothetical protein
MAQKSINAMEIYNGIPMAMSSGNNFRRRNPKKKRGNKMVSKQQVHQMIKGTLGNTQETKFITTFLSGSFSTAASVAFPLLEVSQGLGDSSRVGDSIDVIDVSFNFALYVGDAQQICRVIIVQWAGPIVAATPLDTPDILLNAGVNANNIIAPYNQDNMDGLQLRILYDEIIPMSTSWNVTQSRQHKILHGFQKRIQYVAASNTGYYKMSMHFFSDSTVLPSPSVNGSVLIRYTDS